MPAARRTRSSRVPADTPSASGLRTALVIVTGCSMGAVMAAILVGARGDPREHIDDLWRRVAMPTNPFVPGMFANTFLAPGAVRCAAAPPPCAWADTGASAG